VTGFDDIFALADLQLAEELIERPVFELHPPIHLAPNVFDFVWAQMFRLIRG
jgi:hypothetical protein